MSVSAAIIIPTHNRSDLLQETLASAFAQTHRELQVVVLDDASEDDTPAVLAEWGSRESRLRWERFETSRGACAARNRGLELTDAPFVNFLDSDDLIHPEKVDRQLAWLEADHGAALAVCQMAHFEAAPGDMDLLWNTFEGDDPRLRFLRHDPVWGMHAPLWRRAALEELGGLDESLPMAQDLDLHARSLCAGQRAILKPELLCWCRRHQGPSIGDVAKHRRLRTLVQVYSHLKAQLERTGQLQGEAVQALAGTFLWLGQLASYEKLAETAHEALELARLCGVPKGVHFQFAAVCRLLLGLRKHRVYAAARKIAFEAGYDLDVRERWLLSCRISDEPGLTQPPQNGSETPPAL